MSEEKNNKVQKKIVWKNIYFYINWIISIAILLISYWLSKMIYDHSDTYGKVLLPILAVVTNYINKFKEHIEENDPSCTLGKLKESLNEKEIIIKGLEDKLVERQGKIDSVVAKIKNETSLENLKSYIMEWYIHTDKNYPNEINEEEIKKARKKATRELNRHSSKVIEEAQADNENIN